jgi:hypothetical protein
MTIHQHREKAILLRKSCRVHRKSGCRVRSLVEKLAEENIPKKNKM